MIARSFVTSAIVCITAPYLLAQTVPPKFEVASIRKIASVDNVISGRVEGETYMVRNMTVRPLGLFDFELQWDAASLATGVSVGDAGATGGGPAAGSLFTAIQEQLGIKRVSARAPAPILVIESVEHPTED